MAPTDLPLNFDCANTDPAPIIPGLNTLLLSASPTPTPDIMALVATPSGDGIVNISGANGVGAFAVATANVGAGDAFTVSADTGERSCRLMFSSVRPIRRAAFAYRSPRPASPPRSFPRRHRPLEFLWRPPGRFPVFQSFIEVLCASKIVTMSREA